jgi:hypothetical protein
LVTKTLAPVRIEIPAPAAARPLLERLALSSGLQDGETGSRQPSKVRSALSPCA